MYCDEHQLSTEIGPPLRDRAWVVTLISGGSGVTLQVDAGNPAALNAALLALGEVGRPLVSPSSNQSQDDCTSQTLAVVGTTVPPPAGATIAPPDNESWAAVIEKWIGTEGAGWASKTLLDYRMAATRFAEFAEQRGVHCMDQVTPQLIDSYKRHLIAVCKIVLRTVNKHLAALASLFNWGMRAGYCRQTRSPLEGQAYRRKTIKKTTIRRFKFTPMDFAKIFERENIRKLTKPHEFWCLLFCFLQAIRVGEAAQIQTLDFTEVDGTWVLFIRPHKTEATERYVPIHPCLLSLGILDYITDVRRILGNDGMLFPYLRCDQHNGYGDVPSEALCRYLRRLGLPHQERKVLHCARMTLNNQLKQRGVSEEHRCAYVGHAYETVNSLDYADPMNAVALGKIVMPHLQFDLDTDALRMRPGQFDGVLRRELRRRERLDAQRKVRAAGSVKLPSGSGRTVSLAEAVTPGQVAGTS